MNNFQRGEIRVTELVASLQKNYGANYIIKSNPVYCKDVDIWVYERQTMKLEAVIESTNYAKHCRMSFKDVKRYITNLTDYNCQRILVVSYIDNVRSDLKRFKSNGIEVIEIGHQS